MAFNVNEQASRMFGNQRNQAGGLASGPGVGGGTESSSSSIGGTYFDNPGQVQGAAGNQFNLANQMAGQYGGFLENPTAHPYFQNALGGLLEALVPSEQMARQGLADQFRGAGNMSSSVFANAAQNQESDLLRNRQAVASNLLTTLFPQMTQAMQSPMNQVSSLIQALKQQINASQSNSSSGGGGGLSSGGGAPQQPNVWTGFSAGNLRPARGFMV